MTKILVAYFSATGTTEAVAKSLAKGLGGATYEIKPAQLYTVADLDWHNDQSRANVEMNDASSRPELADQAAPVAQYDTIFIGFPIWWGVAPTLMNTFLEAYDFSGKTVVPFATSGSSAIGETLSKLQPSVSSATKLMPGKVLKTASTTTSEAQLTDWAQKVLA